MTWASRGRVFVVAVAAPLVVGFPASVAPASFIGDFETGNFDQWSVCQNVAVVSAPCRELNTSPLDALTALTTDRMVVETDVVRQGQFAARFEVRQGDQPKGICCGDRAEVSGGDTATLAGEGDDRWYQWSTMFGDPFMFGDGFPTGEGWAVVSQWHADVEGGSPPVAIDAGPDSVGAGRWGIFLSTYNAPGVKGPVFTPWSAPVVRGVWNDIKLHIKWSASDVGFIEFWLNGVRQEFTAAPCPGQTRCMVRTLMPGGGGVYFKQGYYRDRAITATGVVYHDGFSEAHTEAGLAPL